MHFADELAAVGYSIRTTDGYLTDLKDWNWNICSELARINSIRLTPAHKKVIETAQLYYTQTRLSPAMRPLVKGLKELEPDADSMRIKDLFGEKAAQAISLLAGLPKPIRCL